MMDNRDERTAFARIFALRTARVAGMAAIWPLLFNQLLFPVSFTYNRTNDPDVFGFHLAFSILTILITAALAKGSQSVDRLVLSNNKLVALLGAFGFAGIMFTSHCNLSSPAGQTLIGIGVSFVAIYIPVHFLFWIRQYARSDQETVACDMSLSLILFCVVRGVRLTLGIYSLYVTLACFVISSVLALAMPPYSAMGELRERTSLRQIPLQFLVPCFFFIIICNCGIILFNGQAQFQSEPPNRAFLYLAAGAFFALTACASALMERHQRTKFLSAFGFAGVSLFFIGAVFIAGMLSLDKLNGGTVPLLASNVVMAGWTCIEITRTASERRTSATLPAAIALCLIVEVPRMARSLIMYSSNYFSTELGTIQMLALTAIPALTVEIVVVATLIRYFTKNHNGTASTSSRSQDNDSTEAAKEAMLDMAIHQMARKYNLSRREIEVLIASTHTDNAQQIADELFIAKSTVYTHLKRIYAKIGVHSRSEMIAALHQSSQE